MKNIYYLDNAATTKVFDEIYQSAAELNDDFYFNPSATYSAGLKCKKKLEEAHQEITGLLHGVGGKLIFTSSATESNNSVFFGVHLRAGQAVLISAAEHPSVYNAAHELEKRGITVLDIPITASGKIDEEAYEKMLNDNVALISVIHVSNETGAVNDIKRLVKLAKEKNPKVLFHSDGVQAFGKIEVDLRDLGVDFYTISAHKIFAPRGIAGLWIKDKTIFTPLLFGGGQEGGLRSSTENVFGACAFAFSAKKMCIELKNNINLVNNLKKSLLCRLEQSEAGKFLKVNSSEDSSPYIVSVSFNGIKGEVLMNLLDGDGILISTGSACSSRKAGNRTLEAMGVSQSDVTGSVRISFSPYENYDLDYIVSAIEKHVLRLEQNNMR